MTNPEPLRVSLEGETYELDDFELGELEWMEDNLGMAIDDATPMKQAVAFVAVIKRRENPDFSFADARKLKLRALEQPKNGNGNGRKRPTRAAKAASAPANSGGNSSSQG